jgi:hypothetical protein
VITEIAPIAGFDISIKQASGQASAQASTQS